VLLKELAVDVLDRVTSAVIAGIVRPTGRAAEQLSLLLRLAP
jgi:hypothetical protein